MVRYPSEKERKKQTKYHLKERSLAEKHIKIAMRHADNAKAFEVESGLESILGKYY